MTTSFDIITVGGGLGASALAITMARSGARVLVLEKELQFRDRVRGEALVPWGVAEARQLGLADLLLQSCGKAVPLLEMGFGPRNLIETTPQREPMLTYSHPEMQEVLLNEAENSGATVRRGVTVECLECGGPGNSRPAVIARNGNSERLSARLIVGVDGRGSAVRKWAGFDVVKYPLSFQFAGVQLIGVRQPTDCSTFVFNSELGMVIGMVPQTKERWRVYLGYPTDGKPLLQGGDRLGTFLAESIRAVPALTNAFSCIECLGPLASFDVSESWVAHPYRDGIALLGDAAATSDPSFGQGMATALRGVRLLSNALLANSDWDAAGHSYATECNASYQRSHKVSGWLRTLFQDPSPAAAAIRQRAMPRIAGDLTIVPDHLFSGPDLPADDSVRSRLFAES